MTVTTMQVDGADALRAVADGKDVQMIWRSSDGEMFYASLNRSLHDAMKISDCFLVITEEIEESQQNLSENCENAADPLADELADMLEEDLNDVVTDPEISKAPITVEIPNSHKAEKERWRKIDDDMIISLRKSGLTERQIAEKMDTSQVTIHNHICKLRKEKKL